MAARSIATAYVSFGLVNIPVRLFSANQTSESVSFHMLHQKCGTRLKQQYICPKDNEVVDRDEIVKGYEYSKDQYVLFSQEELKAVEEEATKTIAITEFVLQDKVDTVYFDKAYYLGPDKGGERAYTLLSEAMRRSNLVGLAQYAARGKAYLVLLRPVEKGLVMQQLRYAEEVRPFSEVPVPEKVDVKEAELKLALQLIEQTISEEFHPESYRDSVRDRMLEIIQKKVEGQEITISPAETPQAQVIDLMEALKASLGSGGTTGMAARKVQRKPAKSSPRKADKKSSAETSSKKRASK
jgi:DNA end-binding protein Ku